MGTITVKRELNTIGIEGQENECMVGPHIFEHIEGDGLSSHPFLRAVKTHFESIDMANIGLQSIMNLYELNLIALDKSSDHRSMSSKGKDMLH